MKPVFEAFNQQVDNYDVWFEMHDEIYQLELSALKEIHVLRSGIHVEIGCGTGRFGVPLGYDIGIDPCSEMLNKSKIRGLNVVQAIGEQLPFSDHSAASVLMVTALCFAKDPQRVLEESFRILRPRGFLYLGFVPAESELGAQYQAKAKEHPLYKFAHFMSTSDVTELCRQCGFVDFEYRQTLLPNQNASILSGFGIGGFVAMRVMKGGF